MCSPLNSCGITPKFSTNSEDYKDAPFDIRWLTKYFNLDCLDVVKAEFDFTGVIFRVYFKDGKELAAKQFYRSLLGKGCHPQKINNSVCLNKLHKEGILSAGLSSFASDSNQALATREEVNPLNSIIPEVIDPILHNGIVLVNFFLSVLPSAKAMNRFCAQNQGGSWVHAWDINYYRVYADINFFLKEIGPHLFFIKEILSHHAYKQKLECYFIKEENLISKLESFVKNQNGSLYQSLLDVC